MSNTQSVVGSGRRPAVRNVAIGTLTMLAVPLLALAVSSAIFAILEIPYALVRGEDASASRFRYQTDGAARTEIDWLAHGLSVTGIVVSAMAMIGAARSLAGRLSAGPDRAGLAGFAILPALAPALVAIGGTVFWLGVGRGMLRTRTIVDAPHPEFLGGVLVWIALTAAGSWWLSRSARIHARPSLLARARLPLLAIAAAALATTVAGLRPAPAIGLGLGTAPAWFPLSLLSPDGWGPADAALPPLTALSSQLFESSAIGLLCACFVLAYVVHARLSSTLAGAPQPSRSVDSTGCVNRSSAR